MRESATYPVHVVRTSPQLFAWHARLRLGVTAGVLLASAPLLVAHVVPANPRAFVTMLLAYAGLMLALSALARLWHGAGAARAMAWLGALADVTVVFGTLHVALPPSEALIGLVFSLVLLAYAERYHDPLLPLATLAWSTIGYVLVAGSHAGASGGWALIAWHATLYVVVAAAYLAVHAGYHRRVRTLVELFGRAHEGDFSARYDLSGDRYGDGLTIIGRAYNRMREELDALVIGDQLSGCLNRRGVVAAMDRELARARRTRRPLSIVAIDLDGFKSVNDDYGHAQGDAVIRHVGALLRGMVREGDVVGRMGGDEFVLVFPEMAEPEAVRAAARIARIVSTTRVAEMAPGSVGLSAGVATCDPTSSCGREELLGRADKGLYRAKRSGGGRACVATDDRDEASRRQRSSAG